MSTHVMVDIETAGSIILSIGAVKFDNENVIDRFHQGIDPVDSERFGLKIDASTFLYWMDAKRDEARVRLMALPKVDLYAALDGFSMWVRETPADALGSLWGNGATFDNVRIKAAYDAAQLTYPFHYRADECYRTLKNRFPDVEFVQVGTAHDALDDATSQAIHMQAICKIHGIAL